MPLPFGECATVDTSLVTNIRDGEASPPRCFLKPFRDHLFHGRASWREFSSLSNYLFDILGFPILLSPRTNEATRHVNRPLNSLHRHLLRRARRTVRPRVVAAAPRKVVSDMNLAVETPATAALRLMDAAPLLLGAFKIVTDRLDTMSTSPFFNEIDRAAIRTARAAIAKATGAPA